MNGDGAERSAKQLPAQAALASGYSSYGFYSPQLDGLRFVAALLVFIHHAPALPLLENVKAYGWVGVDLFLSISAFLITRLILLEHQRTGSFNLRFFFIRRALRIWPLYLVYVSGVSLLSVLVSTTDASVTFSWWLSHISFSNNVMTAIKGYSPVIATAHLWTIALEEQAYVIMPLLLVAFLAAGAPTRQAVQFCLSALAVLIIARAGLSMASVPHPFIWVLPLRADAFLLGSLLAILVSAGRLRPSSWWAIPGVLLLASVAIFPPVERPGLYQVIGYTAIAAGSSALVASSQSQSAFARALRWKPARLLGKISYGFYVYHLLALLVAEQLLRRVGVLTSATHFATALAVTIILSATSYQVLERPFLLLKERFARVTSRPV